MLFGVVVSSSPWLRPPVRTSREPRKRHRVRAARATVTEERQSVGEIDEITLAGKLKGVSGWTSWNNPRRRRARPTFWLTRSPFPSRFRRDRPGTSRLRGQGELRGYIQGGEPRRRGDGLGRCREMAGREGYGLRSENPVDVDDKRGFRAELSARSALAGSS